MLYIGQDPYPEEKYLRLSDSFICPPEGENTAEVTVRVLNIQYDTGKEFLKKVDHCMSTVFSSTV